MDNYEQYLENKCGSQEYEIEKLKEDLADSQLLSGMKDVKIQELKARVAELEEALRYSLMDWRTRGGYACDGAIYQEAQETLNRQPAQSLDRVKAEALRELIGENPYETATGEDDEDGFYISFEDVIEEANRLEQGE